MSDLIVSVLVGTGGAAAGFFALMVFFNGKRFIDIEKREQDAKKMKGDSEEKAKKILKETIENVQKRRADLKDEEKEKNERINNRKRAVKQKEDALNKKEDRVKEVKFKMATYKEEAQSAENAIRRIDKEVLDELAVKTGETTDSIKKELLDKYQRELDEDAERKIVEIEENLKEEAYKKARTILISTIQRISLPTSVETKSVLIKVPKDQVKGKIVGKNGQNIMYLEELLEVSIVFNDVPNTISISGFNLVIRRKAEKAVQILVRKKGGIDKAVVKAAVEQAERDTDEELYEIGMKALKKTGIKSTDKEFIRTLGRLQYRTSYGQNIMKHSMEVGWISAMLGSELGLDIKTCKVGGFLHDLGKAIDQDPDIKGGHDQLSKELMEKFGFSWEEVHAAWTHHDAAPQETPEALIVKAADAVSGGRPGARQDSIERYIEKMKAIDATVASFQGVKKSYAMSAGREVRVYVDPEKVEDAGVGNMAKEIAKKIEENVVYPGRIKIRVIRRTKITETAK